METMQNRVSDDISDSTEKIKVNMPRVLTI